MEEVNIEEATIFVTSERMAKLFRDAVKSMPNESERTIGREINSSLRRVKTLAYLATKTHQYNSLYKEIIRLKILVDECLEDELLLLKGKNNIIEPRNMLKKLNSCVESLVELSSMKD